ncbi:LPS export ABC transporter periplasmic protein LptC [Rhodanobacter sp. C01]|uniref:LPS export ABC transporter periplasmic protein LptC n=1 Tax=Rhodanobacter sp. C01 TaxID=1945856 RepID=UPI0009879166|nr:LPS export ABC transporter periplasmic protein LptC [Rhodanobacter sp. C01]
MTLRLWLRDRRVPAAIIVIGLAVGVLQLLLWWTQGAPAEHDFVGPPRSGYTLINSRVTEYDVDGLPGLRVQSPHLERREGDESLYLNSPTFQMPAKQPGVPDWDGKSQYGWVNQQGTLLKLQGPVYIHRPPYTDAHGVAQAETTMHTSEITAWPKENRMETAEPAHIVQGERTMTGIGMRANLNDNHLELLDASHITFPPRTPKPSSARPASPGTVRAATGTGQAK